MRVQEGRTIRISKPVEDFLNQHRSPEASFDSYLRLVFGLRDLRGEDPNRNGYWVLHNNGRPLIFTDEKAAKGAAIQLAIKSGKKLGQKPERIIYVREIPKYGGGK